MIGDGASFKDRGRMRYGTIVGINHFPGVATALYTILVDGKFFTRYDIAIWPKGKKEVK